MALADTDDIARVLQRDLTAEEEAQLQESLYVAEEVIRTLLKAAYDETWEVGDPGTWTFWDVYEDASMQLPIKGATIVDVRSYFGHGVDAPFVLLSEGNTYDLVNSGDAIRLRTTDIIEVFENAYGRRPLGKYNRVEIDYTWDGTVPASVRDATAFLSVGIWKAGPSAESGGVGPIVSETIGDYKYTRQKPDESTDTPDDFIGYAYWLLRTAGYIRNRVRVV